MGIIQVFVVVLLLFLPSSSARNLQQQLLASEFPPSDLPCRQPPPSLPPRQSPQCTPMLPPEIAYLCCSRPPPLTFQLHPATAPEFPSPLPSSPVGPPPQHHQPKYLLTPPPAAQYPPMSPETTYLCYSPPPPMTFLSPEFPFPRQPPPAPKLSSPVLSSFIVRLLFAFVGSALLAFLMVGCRTILLRCRAAPNQGVEVEMQGVHVEIQGGLVEMEMADQPL